MPSDLILYHGVVFFMVHLGLVPWRCAELSDDELVVHDFVVLSVVSAWIFLAYDF
jgi:hypothetical protein